MNLEDVRWIHVELSSKCNAWCPACTRNKNGYGLVDGLIEQDLSLETLEEVLQKLPNLETVMLCGNYGDPIMSHNILDAIDLCKKYVNRLQIHTNGSLRSEKWWEDLALNLQRIDHDVWFGIDGIGETHEIYRQATSYDKIIKNASSFIKNGGNATWQFIPYAHNEHQIKDCIRESQKLGFKTFKLVQSYRNNKPTARHWKTGEEFSLLPPTNTFQKNINFVKSPSSNIEVKSENCMHLTQPSIYLGADGKFSNCCYIAFSKNYGTIDEVLAPVDLTQSMCKSVCGTEK